MDGKSVICVATNRTIGPLTIRVNSPICQLSVVRPDFESAVLKQQQDRLASPASPVYSSPGPSPSMPPPSPPTAPGPRPQHPSRPPPPEKKFTKRRQKKKKTLNYVSEIVPKDPPYPIRSFANGESDDDSDGIDPLMPGLLPAGQVGSLEDGYSTPWPPHDGYSTSDDGTDDDYHDNDGEGSPSMTGKIVLDDGENRLQGRGGSSSRTGSSVLDDREDDDEDDNDREDRPPGLLSTENSGEDTEEDSGEDEVLYSRRCLTCQFVCRCPVDISSSQDELVVRETSAPSSNLRRGKKNLENILNKTFSHEIWKYGKIVQTNQPDSDLDEDTLMSHLTGNIYPILKRKESCVLTSIWTTIQYWTLSRPRETVSRI